MTSRPAEGSSEVVQPPCLLLIRPKKDNPALAAALARYGIATLAAPVMEIVERAEPLPSLDRFSAIAVTSANGLRALAAATPQRGIPVYTVGSATADAARAAGFVHIFEASGEARSLARLIGERLPRGARVLHAAGALRAVDLAALLAPAGIDVETALLYDAPAVDNLPQDAAEALRQKAVDGVLIFSPRSARLFVSLLRKEGLIESAASLVAFCLSQAVADAVSDELPAVRTIVATDPSRRALIDSITRHFHASGKPDRS